MNKKIWLVYDKGRIIKNKSFAEAIQKKLKEYNIEVELVFAENIRRRKSFPKFALVRSCYKEVSAFLREKGVICSNSTKVNEIANDKWKTYLFLKERGINVVETRLYHGEIVDWKFPIVIKSRDGHGGSEVFCAKNNEELKRYYDIIGQESAIIQPYINCNSKDIRTYVIDNKIVISVQRTGVGSFKSNYSLGGDVKTVELNNNQLDIIKTVCNNLYFDYAGIDLLHDIDNNYYVNEIEDIVGCRMVYTCSDVKMIELWLEHIIKKIDYIFENNISLDEPTK